jgi:epidermal growth factor receptor substrate 15
MIAYEQEPGLSDEDLKNAVRLEHDEILGFRDLFQLAAGNCQEVLHGEPAKLFFSRSGLSNMILKEIWAICDRGKKGFLTRPEFVLAVRLVALGQVE